MRECRHRRPTEPSVDVAQGQANEDRQAAVRLVDLDAILLGSVVDSPPTHSVGSKFGNQDLPLVICGGAPVVVTLDTLRFRPLL